MRPHRGTRGWGNKRPIVLCPVGFITDHIEVLWDLDTEAKETAEEAGIPFARVATEPDRGVRDHGGGFASGCNGHFHFNSIRRAPPAHRRPTGRCT